MSSKPFADLPSSAQESKIEAFKLNVPGEKLDHFKQLLKLSPVAKDCYENRDEREGAFGVSREWMLNAKKTWEEFDWYFCSS